MTGKLTIQVEAFKPLKSNTLHGFVDVRIVELHLLIHDLSIHQKNGKRWASLPSKPMVSRDGVVRRDERTGKVAYTPILEFGDAETRSAFSNRVIASLLEFAPAAFDDQTAA